ncbi:MAG: radical SAM protein [Nitrospinae bacterium CG11_big_fil_rev_8_21_14_0_20_45_15]|nr:MAG: radical SAM protein [Nitrospinae bacterium CG11_big_fil_rev_8_21_14_0_20_45_15]
MIKVLLVYPNTADVALDNLGFQRVYGLLNAMEGVDCDRYSLPKDWTPESADIPADEIRSHDQGLPVQEFDVVAFSISFEPDYLHVVRIMKYMGLNLERRLRNANAPLIIAGGSAIFINPEPLADCMDAFLVGEAEQMAESFFNFLSARGDLSLKEALDDSVHIPGVYVPKLYEPRYEGFNFAGFDVSGKAPKRVIRYWTPLQEDLCSHSVLHGGDSTFKDMALLEATRGCIWACRFCTAGFIYRPPRIPDLQRTYDSLSASLKSAGAESQTIGLIGPSVTDHPDLMGLAKRITAEGKTLSFSSLRMETLTDELVDLILQSGQKTLTVAVDGPSERMRDVINKAATDDFIVEKCRFLTEKGILHLKIYSIVGLPGETDEDIDAFIRLTERIMKAYIEASQKNKKIGRVTISLSPLVPKPGTPFQWHTMDSVGSLKKKFMKIRKALGRMQNLKMSFGSPNEAYLQTCLSRGDRRLLDFFLEYLDNGYDAKSALKRFHPLVESFVYRQYEKDSVLPWDIIDHGYRNNFLWEDYQRGLKAGRTPVCDTAVCKICGIC